MSTARFDKAAPGWDAKPLRVQLSEVISSSIITTLPLTKKMVGLEYGCGTGLVTLKLAEHLQDIHGFDSSPGMIQVCAEKIDAQGVENVHLHQGDLVDLPVAGFDLICMSMTLHHIEEYQELLGRLSELLKPGGFLAIADLAQEDGTFHDDNTGIAHFGFEAEPLSTVAQECGCTNVDVQTIYTVVKNGREYPVFLLTCQKKSL